MYIIMYLPEHASLSYAKQALCPSRSVVSKQITMQTETLDMSLPDHEKSVLVHVYDCKVYNAYILMILVFIWGFTIVFYAESNI